MKSSLHDKTVGTFHQVKGKIKEVTGELIDNPELEAEGIVEKNAGKAKKEVGKVKKSLGMD
ncbi:MAG: CsbD family protein [Deferrisomatales bacterium]